MLEIVHKHETPPGGWKFLDSRTGISFEDNSIFAIYSRVAASWHANGIEVPGNYKAIVDHEMCQQNPQMECREIGEAERVLTLDDIARFGHSVKNWMANGSKFVSPEEANRRADICIGCVKNKPVRTCLGCTSALTWLSERAGWPQTSKDSELQGCLVCGCLLKLKVHMGNESIDNSGIEGKFPEFCWQNK